MARRKADGTIAPPAKTMLRKPNEGPKVKTGGNSKADRDWMEAEAESLTKLDKAPDGCFWDVLYIWDGYVDEISMEWFDSYIRVPSRQCTGIAYIRDERGGYIIDLDGIRLQRPCLAVPLLGAHVCQKHGGQVAVVQEAAKQRLSDAAEKAANTLITLTDRTDEAGEPVEQGVRLKAANSVLDRTGIKAGSTVEIEIPGYKQVLEDLFGEGGED